MVVVLICSYLYYVNDAVRNVVLREQAEKEITEISSNLGELELAYRNVEGKVTLEYARTAGFVEVETPIFASRKAPATAVSYNSEI